MSVFELERNLQRVSVTIFWLSIPVCYFIHYDLSREKSRTTRRRSKNANIFKNSKLKKKKLTTSSFLVTEVIKLLKIFEAL